MKIMTEGGSTKILNYMTPKAGVHGRGHISYKWKFLISLKNSYTLLLSTSNNSWVMMNPHEFVIQDKKRGGGWLERYKEYTMWLERYKEYTI